jgi:hypothetical protein
MGRTRTPTVVLERAGSFRRHPERRRVDPPSGGTLGLPPAAMTDDEKACWAELAAIAPVGVLSKGDRFIVEVIVKLMVEHRTEGLSGAKLTALTSGLAKLGLSPADRSRVSAVEATNETNPFLMLDD